MTSFVGRAGEGDRGRPSLARALARGWPVAFAVPVGVTAGSLLATGRWYVVLALLLAVPAFIVLHRYPFMAIAAWMVVAPLISVTESGSTRKVFWLFHRGLPVITLAVIVSSVIIGIRARKLPRLGWAEALMGGYLLATLLSIVYTSSEPIATTYILYDRVFIPMCLYLIVRLVEPGERDIPRLIAPIVFILISQSAIGLLSWSAPDVLPAEWLGKLGERTVGSLRSADVFGTTVLFCGLFVLHGGFTIKGDRLRRLMAVLLFLVALLMLFLTFSRASWTAGLIAGGGTLYLYRDRIRYIVAVAVPMIGLVLASGLLGQQLEFARYRFRSEQSEESALSRLPVMYASIRMFRAEPILGWGYENFDRFDRQFQGPVGNLVYPDKDHASHNLYLTILAEQGITGFVLFLAPVIYWLRRTKATLAFVPRSGIMNGKFLGILWLVVAGYIVVNNFARMQVTFGLGLWWLTLGFIGAVVSRASTDRGRASEGMPV